jgi:hypothetical protein
MRTDDNAIYPRTKVFPPPGAFQPFPFSHSSQEYSMDDLLIDAARRGIGYRTSLAERSVTPTSAALT